MTSDFRDRRVCFKCIGEEFVRNRLKLEGKRFSCFYCGQIRKGFSLNQLADIVESVVNEHYQRTAEEPSNYEYVLQQEGLSDLWFRDGQPITELIKELLESEQSIAEDVWKVLHSCYYDDESSQMGEEGPFDREAHYEEKSVGHGDLKDKWEHFEKSLKTEARYFNESARATLKSVFEGILDHETWEGKPVVVDCGPKAEVSALYRARVFQRYEDTVRAMERPDLEVGPPPPARATAGRMNARGISVFYGALDAETALAEVRPPVGSMVLVVRFEILRPVRLLDVEALSSVRARGSLFDPSFTRRLQKARFLKGLSERISSAVMPDDEPLDYLPTQAIAEFLATEVNPPLDGIIYRSVQTGDDKQNVVLFHNSSRIENMDVPKGTTFSTTVFTEDGDGDQYLDCSVWETPPPPLPQPAPDPLEPTAFYPVPMHPDVYEDRDYREVTLKPDIASVTFHLVKAASITSENRYVRRHRMSQSAPSLDTRANKDVSTDPF